MRSARDGHGPASDGLDSEPDYVWRIVRQREVLMSVAAMLAEVRFEPSEEPEGQRKV